MSFESHQVDLESLWELNMAFFCTARRKKHNTPVCLSHGDHLQSHVTSNTSCDVSTVSRRESEKEGEERGAYFVIAEAPLSPTASRGVVYHYSKHKHSRPLPSLLHIM